MKALTLIYTINTFNSQEIENINYLFKKINGIDLELIVASDNPKINEKLNKFLDFGIMFVPANVNLGKFSLVKKIINNFVDSLYFKIVDPDDIILIEPLSMMIDFINALNWLPIIKMNPALEYMGNKRELIAKEINELNNIFFEKTFRPKFSMVNWGVIIPTRNFKLNKINTTNQTKSSDILIALTDKRIGDMDIIETDINFYLYNYRNGISSDYYSKKMIEQMFSFLEILEKNNHLNFTTSPNIYDFIWLLNSYRESDLDEIEIIDNLHIAFNMLKKIGKDEWCKHTKWDERLILNIKKYIRRESNEWI